MIILSAYSLVWKLAVSVAFRPNRVKKAVNLNHIEGQGETVDTVLKS